MKTNDSDNRDIKAGIAASVAAMLPHEERVEAVQGLLRVDEIEARLLISHGRRLARAAASHNANPDDRASFPARQKRERVS